MGEGGGGREGWAGEVLQSHLAVAPAAASKALLVSHWVGSPQCQSTYSLKSMDYGVFQELRTWPQIASLLCILQMRIFIRTRLSTVSVPTFQGWNWSKLGTSPALPSQLHTEGIRTYIPGLLREWDKVCKILGTKEALNSTHGRHWYHLHQIMHVLVGRPINVQSPRQHSKGMEQMVGLSLAGINELVRP